MKRTFAKIMMGLLVLQMAVPSVLAADATPGYDHDENDYIAPAAGLALLIGGITWFVVKKVKKSKKAEQTDANTSIVAPKKAKMNLLMDMVPIKRSLASTDVDVDYRVGVSIRF